MSDLREKNSRLVLELQSLDKKASISVTKDHSTGPRQIQRMHKIADAVLDLATRPELFARVSGDEVPQDVLESMKNPLALPSTWRKNSPHQVQPRAPIKV
jgi:hypothetical protein